MNFFATQHQSRVGEWTTSNLLPLMLDVGAVKPHCPPDIM